MVEITIERPITGAQHAVTSYRGTARDFLFRTVDTRDLCRTCGGRGRIGDDIPCWRCNAKGKHERRLNRERIQRVSNGLG